MYNLIEGILQYSRIGRVKEAMVPVDFNICVENVIDLINPPENIKIIIDNKLPTIVLEKTRIEQLLQNLIGNAIKYMDKPQGKIQIGCTEKDDYYEFYIKDNGPGIDERYFNKIFQIFQTLKARDEFESTGIGLTIVKKIVEMYDGKITVSSKLNEGTTFYFTLPVKEVKIPKEMVYEIQ
jgi:signal transduction histidine kinase